MNSFIRTVTIVAMSVAGLVGCTDLKPLETDVKDLKSEVGILQTQTQEIRRSADQASASSRSAADAASAAQKSSNEALAMAQSSQSHVDALNEKLDRMFKRKLEK
jgi:methyl-accepting chemotaxis protein